MSSNYHSGSRKSILIDFDGVVARLNQKKALKLLEGEMSELTISPRELLNGYFYFNPLHKEIDTGTMRYSEMLESIRSDCWSGSPERWQELWKLIWDCYDIDFELLEVAREGSDSLLLVTDNHRDFIDWFSAIPALALLSDRVLCSALTGLCKPDPRLFELALERLETAPGNALFIDDSEKNVVGATKFGLQALHFIERESALKTVREFTANDNE